MKIAILLGSFNPIHIGHLYMATSVLNKGLADKVIFVPSVQNPCKKEKAIDFGDRCFMIQLVIGDIPGCILSCVDYRTEEPHYSSNTLKILKEEYPNDELFLLVGSDLSVKDWHNSDWILENFKLITVNRIGYESKSDINDTLNVSSSQIRELIKNKKQIYPLVPKIIDKYIKKHNLYEKFSNN